MKKRKSPCTPLRVKAKGKETRPGCFSIPLRPRACVRGRYAEAGAAADELIALLGGSPAHDRGESAAAMYCRIEVVPLWLRLWRLSAAKLPRKGRAVLYALMVDWRTMPAAKMAGVSRPTVDGWKTKLKVHFAQCWRAYERDFVK